VADLSIFRRRRDIFLSHLGSHAAVIPAAELVTHHADCEYPFRQNSDFWYLTGFDEPNAVALLLPHKPKGEQYVLFVLPKESSAEVWTGFRWGTKGVLDNFDVDISHPLNELPKLLSHYLDGAEGIAFRVGKHPHLEPLVLKTWSEYLQKLPRSGSAPLSMIAPCPILHDLRLRKDDFEIERMRIASRISAEGHEIVREFARPGMNEKELQAQIEKYFLEKGTRGPAYGSIIASGDNACVLHYTANNSLLRDGDLVLIDAGCSLDDYYNGDITRTFPINGKFSGEQKALYEITLIAQEAAIRCVRPGDNAENVHMTALKHLIEGLVDIGLLVGEVDSIIEQEAYSHLYMHRTGHWLGLDVHDVGAYRLGDYHLRLEPGMVLTVEPGIYISDRLAVPKGQPEIDERWKGIGIRIEDDVLVTKDSVEVLSRNAAKNLIDLES
jgi:Xaa-Pro aminopeptidase